MQLTKVTCPSNKISIKCPYSMTPTRLVIHNTANDASAMSEISYMLGNNKEVSFHFAVDDYRVVQGIETNRNAWHAGDGHGKGNMQGIAIEICYSKSGGDRFIKAEQNAAKFIASLLKERGWGIDKVTKHQDYSGKYCPHRTLDMGWERFLNMIRAELGQTQVDVPTSSKEPNYTGKITYQSYDNKKKKWLPEVNSHITVEYAGNLTNDMGGLRAKPTYGEILIQSHVIGKGWLGWISSKDYSKNNKTNGNTYSGLYGQKIDMIRIKSTKGHVDYRVYDNVKNKWLPWVSSTNPNEYAGNEGNSISGIQMK